MPKKAPGFEGPLKADFEEYVRFMSTDHKFTVETTILKAFDRHMIAAGAAAITPELIEEFAFAPEGLSSSQYEHRCSTVEKFWRYCALVRGEPVPPTTRMRLPSNGKYAAYHYTDEEIGAILEHLAPRRPGETLRVACHAYQAIVGLLCSSGLRISEALNLDEGDVNLDDDVLYIENTKFRKDRYVPIHPSVAEMLREYAADRDSVFPRGTTDGAFFTSSRGTRIRYGTFEGAFKRAVREADLSGGGPNEPRIHDMRHTFAVNRIKAWYEEEVNPSDMLSFLATYMGHIKLETSVYYMDMKAEAMALGSRGFRPLGGSHEAR